MASVGSVGRGTGLGVVRVGTVLCQWVVRVVLYQGGGGGDGHCARGQCGFSTPTQWVVRWFRTKGDRYRYLEHSFPESQPYSGTIVCTTDSTFLSYFQTCKKGG